MTHKKLSVSLPNDRTILLVSSSPDSFGYLRDNTGDNISEKNPSFCELTALYWIWKNDKESSIVSLEHYRRLFLSKKGNLFHYHYLSKGETKSLMGKYDLMVRTPYYFRNYDNLWEEYSSDHDESDLIKTRAILTKQHPEYLPSFDFVMKKAKTASFLNMFLGKKEIVDSYCEWLFPILFSLEKEIDLSKKNTYQKRIFGFLSERLFNVWINFNKNKIRVGYLEVCNTEEKHSLYMIKHIFHKVFKR